MRKDFSEAIVPLTSTQDPRCVIEAPFSAFIYPSRSFISLFSGCTHNNFNSAFVCVYLGRISHEMVFEIEKKQISLIPARGE